jgi:hypothetical protein
MKKAWVELNIFSGRPDPGWEIPLEQAMELYKEAISFPATDAKKLFEGLGYRGFRVFIDQNDEQRIICTVFSDLVKIVSGSTTQYKRDKERKMEKWLLLSAKTNIDEPLFKIIEKQIL